MKLQENIVRFVPINSEGYEMQDQIIICKSRETSPEKGMLRNWNLQEL